MHFCFPLKFLLVDGKLFRVNSGLSVELFVCRVVNFVGFEEICIFSPD